MYIGNVLSMQVTTNRCFSEEEGWGKATVEVACNWLDTSVYLKV